MLAYHVHAPGRIRNPIVNRFPVLAVVRRHEDVNVVVVAAVPVERSVRRSFRVFRRNHPAYIRPFRDPRHTRGHVFPVFSAIPRHLQIAVVGPGPQNIRRQRRFAQRRDRGIFLRAVVAGKRILVGRLAENLQLVAVHLCRQVTSEPRPSVAAVHGLEEIISTVVDRLVVVRGNHHR